MRIIWGCIAILLLPALSSVAWAEDRHAPTRDREHQHHHSHEPIRCYWYDLEPLAPHNVAGRVLEFSRELGLTHEQVSRMAHFVEDYDRENRGRERELEAAQSELFTILKREEIDFSRAVENADKITRLEFYLWQDFIDHLQQIKQILTPPQNRTLGTLWEIRCKPS